MCVYVGKGHSRMLVVRSLMVDFVVFIGVFCTNRASLPIAFSSDWLGRNTSM